jgi:hypothetical protein
MPDDRAPAPQRFPSLAEIDAVADRVLDRLRPVVGQPDAVRAALVDLAEQVPPGLLLAACSRALAIFAGDWMRLHPAEQPLPADALLLLVPAGAITNSKETPA